MKLVFETRASAILYNFLISNNLEGKFLIPANVCLVVPLTFFKAGVPFEFVDISGDDLCIQQKKVLSLLEKDPSYIGVFFVRTYGVMRSYKSFFLKVREIRPEIIIIDDRCQAPPDFIISNMDGSDLILFSTGYAKYIDINWGGFGYINDKHNYQRNLLRFKEKELVSVTKYYKEAIVQKNLLHHMEDFHWLNTRPPQMDFSDYKTIVLNKMRTAVQHKMKINKYYREHFPKKIQLADEFQQWRFNILVENKEVLIKKIFDSGLFASSHFASLKGIMTPGKAENAEKFHSKIVNLFNDHYFDLRKAKLITDIVLDHISTT